MKTKPEILSEESAEIVKTVDGLLTNRLLIVDEADLLVDRFPVTYGGKRVVISSPRSSWFLRNEKTN